MDFFLESIFFNLHIPMVRFLTVYNVTQQMQDSPHPSLLTLPVLSFCYKALCIPAVTVHLYPVSIFFSHLRTIFFSNGIIPHPKFLAWDDLAPPPNPGNMWQCLETFLIILSEQRGCCWLIMSGGRGHHYTSYSAQDSPHNRELPGPKCH